MFSSPLRWLISNISTLLLALALALVVWISAVTAADPDVEFTRTVPIEVEGLDPTLELISPENPGQARVTLRAPRSIRDRMINTQNTVHAWIDLSDLQAGNHTVDVQVRTSEIFHPVRVISISPEFITVNLENTISRSFQVKLDVIGNPAIGYQKGVAARTPSMISVTGPESMVSLVEEVRARLNITDAKETINIELPIEALDANGDIVRGITLAPDEISITQPISLLGGYRNIVVKPVTEGQVAQGYRLTNLTVSPPNVLVFSRDPQLVMDLPSFIETDPLDLNGAEDDMEVMLSLRVPQGVNVVGDEAVFVQVNIAAIEGSITLSLPVEPKGLLPRLAAEISPPTVDVIISGPVPVLSLLAASDIIVTIDVQGLDLGTHQLEPQIEQLPERLVVETILPANLEVTIIRAPTATATPSPSP
jgi:YbbR domain-containing protein